MRETPNTNVSCLVFRWTICARVTNKSQIRTWSNSRGEGKLFSIELVDESVSMCHSSVRELPASLTWGSERNMVVIVAFLLLETFDALWDTGLDVR